MDYVKKYLEEFGLKRGNDRERYLTDFQEYLREVNAFVSNEENEPSEPSNTVKEDRVSYAVKELWPRVINQAAYGTEKEREVNFRNCISKMYDAWVDIHINIFNGSFFEYCIKELGPRLKPEEEKNPTPKYMPFEKWLEERKHVAKLSKEWDRAMMEQLDGEIKKMNFNQLLENDIIKIHTDEETTEIVRELCGKVLKKTISESKKDEKKISIIEISLKIS